MIDDDPDVPPFHAPGEMPPLRLCRDLGRAAMKIHRTRGTGRRFKAYRNLLRSIFRTAYPPRIALVGAGEGIEVAEAILGLKACARGPSGLDKALYVLHLPKDAKLIARVRRQPRYAARGADLVPLLAPWGETLDKLTATGGFWFSLVAVAPTVDPDWAIESLRALRGLCTTGTLIIVCRCNDRPMQKVLAALDEFGWTAVRIGEIAALRRGAPAINQHATPPQEGGHE